jgi:hypothetical protein
METAKSVFKEVMMNRGTLWLLRISLWVILAAAVLRFLFWMFGVDFDIQISVNL